MLTKVLVIGDVHATADDLQDCEKLVNYILKVLNSNSIDHVVFMGDQTHTHGIVDVNVLHFWKRAFAQIKAACKSVYVLVGNHDLPGNTGKSDVNSMEFFEDVKIVSDCEIVDDEFCLVGYQHSNLKFQEIVNSVYTNRDIRLFLCHQTFNGASFENGFRAKDGIEPDTFEKDCYFISGHIHNKHNFGNIYYIGSPRWRTLSDANQEKSIDIVYVLPNPVTGTPYTVEPVILYAHVTGLRRIFAHDIFLEDNLTPEQQFDTFRAACRDFSPSCVVHFSVRGDKKNIDAFLRDFEMLLNSHSIDYTIKKIPNKNIHDVVVRESEGISVALQKFVEKLRLSAAEKQDLDSMIQKRIYENG